jgi:hypothetical protein
MCCYVCMIRDCVVMSARGEGWRCREECKLVCCRHWHSVDVAVLQLHPAAVYCRQPSFRSADMLQAMQLMYVCICLRL